MNPVFPSIFHRGPMIALVVAWLVLVLCAAVLLASVASGPNAAGVPQSDGPLLAPFRWVPLQQGLA